MNFQQAVEKWRALNKKAAAASGSCGWNAIRMDDFMAENMLKGAEWGAKMEIIEPALTAYEEKIDLYIARFRK